MGTGRRNKVTYPSGFLLVDKPVGMTSRKVVDVIRDSARYRGKIGHSGTLDPMASGLIVLCLGKATRLASYLIRDDKSYLGVLQLGVETDTGDAEGKVVFSNPDKLEQLDDKSVREAFETQRGIFHQVPPRFSARKVRGRRAYELARSGQDVQLEASRIEVKELDVLKIDRSSVRFYVKCSSGTYVRSIALDIGRFLGTGAHLTSLRRLDVGPFSVGEAEGLEKLKRECHIGNLEKWLFPPGTVLEGLSRVFVDCNGEKLLKQGSPVVMKEAFLRRQGKVPMNPGEEVQILSSSSDFLAVGRVDREDNGNLVLYPAKVLG